jgi:hypothetical protein
MRRVLLLPFLMLSAFVVACDDSDVSSPGDDHEHEAITTVVLKVANLSDPSDTATVRFLDADGDGGAAPVLPARLVLRSGATYAAGLRFLDQSNPADVHDLNEEIGGSESDDHRVFWVSRRGALAATITDRDAGGLPLGLTADLQVAGAGSDTLRVVLRHLPGIKTAGSTITDGETDADIDFPVSVVAGEALEAR